MTNFLSLLRELHDQIYDLALIASSSVVAWSGKSKVPVQRSTATPTIMGSRQDLRNAHVDHRGTVSSVQGLALNLLRCNSTVAREAAMSFYGKDTVPFACLGEHNWDPIVSWLQTIGARNRGHLTKLEARARWPEHAYQERDGTRTEVLECHQELYQRSPHLYRSPKSTEAGIVDNLNHPAIKALFAILASGSDAPTLTLTLQLDYGFLLK